MTSYAQRLDAAVQSRKTPALVGIDPVFDWLPRELRDAAERRVNSGGQAAVVASAFEAFGKAIVEIVSPLVPAVKPQVAFFERLGVPGMQALHSVMTAARKAGLLVIADAKRGDIGSTATAYADGWLAGEDPEAAAWPSDALTVNPYLGDDTLAPFVQTAAERGAGLYVLVRTSNPGAATFQDRTTDGKTVYQAVAERVESLNVTTDSTEGPGYGSVGAVVGATWPEELKALRREMPHVPLLIPGYGSQGGTAADVADGFDERGFGALVNSSRGINFAWRKGAVSEQYEESQWREAIEAATRRMIEDLREHTPAAAL